MEKPYWDCSLLIDNVKVERTGVYTKKRCLFSTLFLQNTYNEMNSLEVLVLRLYFDNPSVILVHPESSHEKVIDEILKIGINLKKVTK